MKPFYVMQSACLRVGRSTELHFGEPAGGNFISSTLANHSKLSAADEPLCVTAPSRQVCAPRDMVLQRSWTWQDPACMSPCALENKTCDVHRAAEAILETPLLPSTFLLLPLANGARLTVSVAVQDCRRAVKLLAKGGAQMNQKKCSFLSLFFNSCLTSLQTRVSRMAVSI